MVADLVPGVVNAYVRAFIRHLRASNQLHTGGCVVGWDLRPSSPEIAASVGHALQQEGLRVEWAGLLPTPALALHAMALGAPGIMVTGSHIPFDRNGIKFYTAKGEILKADEAAITSLDIAALLPLDSTESGLLESLACVRQAQARDSAALQAYRDRYLQCLPSNALAGLRIGVYQHSAVGRDFLADLLGRFGASVVPLGRSDTFVPIDTEAVSAADEALAAAWCAEHRLNAVVSTDGDGDRPWICDEHGHFMRGDVVGILTAQWLGVQAVVTPVSSNTALEKSGLFKHCVRTRIGSPYVIEAMQNLAQQGHAHIAGFEANGGFLLQSHVKGLAPLPTRDSILPILAVLAQAQERGLPLSALPGQLPARYTQADRIQNLPTDQSQTLIARLREDALALQAFVQFSGSTPQHIDSTDGLRITLDTGDIVHLRPSGNAPELRCYTEAGSPAHAQLLLEQALIQIKATSTFL